MERTPRNGPLHHLHRPLGGSGLATSYAYTTSVISKASGLTLGSGTADLCTVSGGVLTVTDNVVDIYWDSPDQTIKSGSIVLLIWVGDGWGVIGPASCSSFGS